MKQLILTITSLISAVFLFAQTPANDPHWQLLWEDNFTGNLINTSKWTIIDWADGNAQTMYLKENVKQMNDNLVITVKSNDVYCPPNPPTVWGARRPCDNRWYNYNSGWIESTQQYNTQFGYIESRIKLPYGFGYWPAFWTFVGSGVQNSTTACEIDIFEMLGGGPFGSTNMMTTNLHTEYPDIVDKFLPLALVNFNYTSYHTYGIEWSPTKIIWYVDGSPVRIFANPGIIDPVRIILNFAIQTDYLPNSSTLFPIDMLVDYVKVYNLKKDCNTVINTCNYNFSSYDNKVKKEIIIGGNGCVNSIPINTSQTLRATDGVLINGDFTIPIGAGIYVDVNPCY